MSGASSALPTARFFCNRSRILTSRLSMPDRRPSAEESHSRSFAGGSFSLCYCTPLRCQRDHAAPCQCRRRPSSADDARRQALPRHPFAMSPPTIDSESIDLSGEARTVRPAKSKSGVHDSAKNNGMNGTADNSSSISKVYVSRSRPSWKSSLAPRRSTLPKPRSTGEFFWMPWLDARMRSSRPCQSWWTSCGS